MEIVKYIQSCPIRSFEKGETILRPGDSSDYLYAIREGFLKITTLDDEGRQKLLWIIGRYDLVPVENLFSHSPVNYYYSTICDGSMYVVNKADFLAYAEQNPPVMTQVARGLSEHYDNLLGRMNAMEQSAIRLKLLHVLHNICGKFAASSDVNFHELGLRLTHQDFADMIGATRESVTLALGQLQSEGYISYSRSEFTVHLDKINEIVEIPA